ncbi:MAG: hypothetical protein KJO55_01365, partial [Gammaproteobacteria bacterium]|nr:hypothetical protein [Gammaproteobacteria bacterium]
MHCPIARATLALLASTLLGISAIAADADQPAAKLVYCLQVQATGGECDDAAAEDARRLGPFINPDALLDTPEYAQSLDGLANDLAEYRYDNRLLGGGFIELDRILADMDFATETVTKGWFERFMEWLADKLDDGEQEDSALLDWLDQLTLPDWIAKAILWTSVGILV